MLNLKNSMTRESTKLNTMGKKIQETEEKIKELTQPAKAKE